MARANLNRRARGAQAEACGSSRRLKLLHGFIQRSVELVHRRFGFVAHVRKTEGGAFDLAVAAIDENALVFDQLLELSDIHRAATGLRAVVDAGERDGFETFLR